MVKVSKTFKMKNTKQYYNLYLACDVLLSADVFEKFRSTCLEYCKLDSSHYLNSPSLGQDAVLKMTRVELELISDIDMYQFVKKGMSGGISYISQKI